LTVRGADFWVSLFIPPASRYQPRRVPRDLICPNKT
jgi:hypothetical protein